VAQVIEGRKAVTEGGDDVNFSSLWFLCAVYEITSAGVPGAWADTFIACTVRTWTVAMALGGLNIRDMIGIVRGRKAGLGLKTAVELRTRHSTIV